VGLWLPAVFLNEEESKTMTRPQETPKATRIMLVDDHPIVREGLAESINRENDLHVCAQAEDHHEALKAIETTKPDLVVVDLMLRNSSGLELIKDPLCGAGPPRWSPGLHYQAGSPA
jgi:PleD family two-component response regulator